MPFFEYWIVTYGEVSPVASHRATNAATRVCCDFCCQGFALAEEVAQCSPFAFQLSLAASKAKRCPDHLRKMATNEVRRSALAPILKESKQANTSYPLQNPLRLVVDSESQFDEKRRNPSLVLLSINTVTYQACSLRGKICYAWH